MNFSKLKGITIITFQNDKIKLSVHVLQLHIQSNENTDS